MDAIFICKQFFIFLINQIYIFILCEMIELSSHNMTSIINPEPVIIINPERVMQDQDAKLRGLASPGSPCCIHVPLCKVCLCVVLMVCVLSVPPGSCICWGGWLDQDR